MKAYSSATSCLLLSSALLLTACGGSSSGGGAPAPTPATSSSNPASTSGSSTSSSGSSATSTSSTAPQTKVWYHPAATVLPPQGTAGSTQPPATGTNPGTNTGVPGVPGLPASFNPELLGSIPPDPKTGFNGTLYFAGRRFMPGTTIVVSYQGVPTKILPATFDSSELLGVYVFLTVPGDYTFEALLPNGQLSNPIQMTVDQGPLPGVLNPNDPELQMMFPPSVPVGFTGTIWIMGENFSPGASLLVKAPNFPATPIPLTYVNNRSLAWTLTAPLPGSFSARVINPDLRSTDEVIMTVVPQNPGQGQLFNRPSIAAVSSQVSAPFLGTVHIFGADFLPGAVVEMTDIATQTTVTMPVAMVSSDQVQWMLAYPQPGSYEVRVINPDGQSTGVFNFDVQ